MERTLSATILNSYPTKILELRPLPRDRKYADFFNVFLLDTLVYAIAEGRYNPVISIYSQSSNSYTSLTAKEALVLLYYAQSRVGYETPTELPVHYQSRTAYRFTPNTIPDTFATFGMVGKLNNYINVDSWKSDSTYPLSISTPTEFSSVMANHFLKALYRVVESRRTSDLTTLKAMEAIVPSIFNQDRFSLDLVPGVTTYQNWFGLRSDIYKRFIVPYEESSDPQTDYDDLATTLFTALVPVNDIMSQYGNFELSANSYARLKQLFISLCSYDVTFVDTSRDVYTFVMIEEIGIASTAKSLAISTAYPMYDTVDIKTTASNSIDVNLTDIELELSTSVSVTFDTALVLPIDLTVTMSRKAPVVVVDEATPVSVTASRAIAVPDAFPIAVGFSA